MSDETPVLDGERRPVTIEDGMFSAVPDTFLSGPASLLNIDNASAVIQRDALGIGEVDAVRELVGDSLLDPRADGPEVLLARGHPRRSRHLDLLG